MNDTSLSSMDLRQNNIRNYWNGKKDAVLSVGDLLMYSKQDLLSSMTIRPSKSEGLHVLTVTVTSLDGTEIPLFSGDLPIILIEGLVSTFLNLSYVDGKRKPLNED